MFGFFMSCILWSLRLMTGNEERRRWRKSGEEGKGKRYGWRKEGGRMDGKGRRTERKQVKGN